MLLALCVSCDAFLSPLSLRPPTLPKRGGIADSARRATPVSKLRMGAEYDLLSGVDVVSVASGESMPVTKAWNKNGGKSLVVLLTHWGDLTCWEYAQKLRYSLPELQEKGVQVTLVGIGGQEAAKEFAESNGIPTTMLYTDSNAACAGALGLSPGFGRDTPQQPQANDASPYLRLLPMLLGVGSPGTLGRVIYGYFGDRSSNPKWIPEQLKRTQTGRFPYVDPATFDALGDGYLRPFELATVRLQNMISVLSRWEQLIPDNKDLIVQQGGTLVFDGEDCTYRYDDKGILVYAPLEEVLAAATA